jgi:hypothetical protein
LYRKYGSKQLKLP